MTSHEASRTLVKSAPELWAECSDATSLAKHLGAFGEIRITRLEPETAVAWEGDAASGTVRLEPSGWGTRVLLTASSAGAQQEAQPVHPDPAADVEVAAHAPAIPMEAQETGPELVPPNGGVFARLMGLLGRRRRYQQDASGATVDAATEADDVLAVTEPVESVAKPGERGATGPAGEPTPTAGALDAALDSLGRPHRRPYSRS